MGFPGDRGGFGYAASGRRAVFGGDSFGQAPLEAVAAGIEAIGANTFTPDRGDFSRQRRAVIAANTELQEREALKGADTSTAIAHRVDRAWSPRRHHMAGRADRRTHPEAHLPALERLRPR